MNLMAGWGNCEECAGTGLVLVRTGYAYEFFDQGDYDTADCSVCGGTGNVKEDE